MTWTPYDNLTDAELIRIARDEPNPLVVALMERLEMRIRDIKELEHRYATMNPFKTPTLAEMRSKELDEAQRNLLLAEQQRDYYIHTINYLTARIQALEPQQ